MCVPYAQNVIKNEVKQLFGNNKMSRLAILLICSLLIMLTSCNITQGGNSTNSASTPPALGSPPPASSEKPKIGQDWTTYHYDNQRTGAISGVIDPHQLGFAWNTLLDGSVYAEPLVVNGHVIVATENDTVYALDPTNGHILWHNHVGTPVQQSTLPCGDINPLGMTGTPVYDPATHLIFVVAEETGPHHLLIAIDAASGKVRFQRNVDVAGMDPPPHQQRAALALANGRVYVAYGGLAGDCGDYIGTVVALQTNNQGPLLSFRVPTAREGGIWAPPGPAIDEAGNVYVAVGNGASTSGPWDHSDSVLRLSPTLHLEDAFAPQNWAQENGNDTDLGSMGPLLLPGGKVFIAGKSGSGYILHQNALGGIGGQVSQLHICNGVAMGGGVVVGNTILVPCADGVRHVTINADNSMKIDWHVASMQQTPIVGGHTADGSDPQGNIYAVNLATGKTQATFSAYSGIALPRFATPTLSGNMLFLGTTTGIMAVILS